MGLETKREIFKNSAHIFSISRNHNFYKIGLFFPNYSRMNMFRFTVAGGNCKQN